MSLRPAWVFALLVAPLVLPSTAQSTSAAAPQASSKAGKSHASPPALVEGALQDGIYRNAYFGFSFKIPYGWVDRTAAMSGDSEAGKSMVLLSVFERPPEASGEGVNSAVVIAVESTSSYPGLKTAADYFGPLTELTTSKGFEVVEEPYEVRMGAAALVRSDFNKKLGSGNMYQASLVTLEKGYAISFTFLGSSEDEVDERIDGLALGSASVHAKPAK